MIYREEKGDLFTAPQGYCLAHCIAGDFGMGAGIATQFNEKFDMKNRLINLFGEVHSPFCIQVDNVFNLITKDVSYSKPTYDSLLQALTQMKEIMVTNGNKKLAIPQIGCGLDGLKWNIVRAIIKDIFQETDIEIVVYIYEERNEDGDTNDFIGLNQVSFDEYVNQLGNIHLYADSLDDSAKVPYEPYERE